MNSNCNSSKVETFIGLIDERGAVKSSFKNECILKFNLCAFIKNGETLREEELAVITTMQDFDYLPVGLAPLTIVEFIGEVVSFPGQKCINMLTIFKTEADHSQLLQIYQRRLKPVIFQSTCFGSLIFDGSLNWYEARVKWQNLEIGLHLNVEENRPAKLESGHTALR